MKKKENKTFGGINTSNIINKSSNNYNNDYCKKDLKKDNQKENDLNICDKDVALSSNQKHDVYKNDICDVCIYKNKENNFAFEKKENLQLKAGNQ